MFVFWMAPISEEFASKVKPINRLIEIIDDNITKGQFDVDRMYVNGYDYGNCPTVHVDNTAEGFYTLLYYANPEWQADWTGETVFYNEAQNDTNCVLDIRNQQQQRQTVFTWPYLRPSENRDQTCASKFMTI